MGDPPRSRGEGGQAAVEWVALLLLVALLLAGLLAARVRGPGAALAEAVASRILCAVSVGESCDHGGLVAAYGEEVAALVRENAPLLVYEPGMRALPVDFRRCRSTSCG